MALIKKLCRDNPAERLGYQKGGISDIQKHNNLPVCRKIKLKVVRRIQLGRTRKPYLNATRYYQKFFMSPILPTLMTIHRMQTASHQMM
ncbi:hypothetical protein NQ317_002190 [Molorchus minor]|uniref:Uncharacterized protein n=1 Tax=Molorchus minor TaxID=1323400 RepID=A0ABQ9IYM6_9CUCU|nr:hypothetical protein NQ317_002190 [Molorchus minor]